MPYTIEKHGNVEYRVSVDADGFAVYEPVHTHVMHAVPSAPSDMRVEG